MKSLNHEPRPPVLRVALWLALLLALAMVVSACDAEGELTDLPTDIDARELPEEAREYIALSREAVSEMVDTVPSAIILESITQPATDDEPYVIDVTAEGELFRFHGQDGAVVLVSEPIPIVPTLDPEVGPEDDAREETPYTTADLVFALEEEGATVTLSTEPEPAPDILAVSGQAVNVGADQIYVYEYENTAAAAADAVRISPTGYEIGPTVEDPEAIIVDWIAQPHFYQYGNLIVVYVGDSAETLQVLEDTIGSPFAGAGV